MPSSADTSAARPPKQARGAARVEALIRAAEGLIVAGGVESMTLSAVARSAGAAQGTVYRFFPSREALLTTLQERYAAEIEAIVRRALEAFVDRGETAVAHDVVSVLLWPLADYYARTPAYSEIRHALSRPGRETAHEARLDAIVVDVLARMLRTLAPRLPRARTRLAAATILEAGDALVAYGVTAESRAERRGRLREAEAMLTGYVEGVTKGRARPGGAK